MNKKDPNADKDDSGLFRQAMSDVKPLQDNKTEPYRKKRRPAPLEFRDNEAEQEEFADIYTDTPDFLDFQRPGIQHRLYRDLQRGTIEPEATLDLHGMRVVDARQTLVRFLKQSLQVRRRCVRIIHGKGRGSGAGQPVLKQKINQWLPQKEEVLAYFTAPRWDGGTGAVYVLLSRKWGDQGDY